MFSALFVFICFFFFRHAKDNKGFDEEEEGMQNMMYFFLSKLPLKVKFNVI